MTGIDTTFDGIGGLYGPSSEAWRLNREAMLLLGAGPRALLLQLAHPLVAAGVGEHSDFRADPWRRLRATLRSYLAIVYGTTTAARAEIRRLNELHRTIAGTGYRARDPELSLWVHATLVDTTIVAYDAWVEPLVRDRRARYYAETLPIGRAFGVPAGLLPADLDAFEAYVAAMLGPGGPVRVSAVARELADAVLHPPLGPVMPALGRRPVGRLRLDAVAGDRPAAGWRPRRLRPALGSARAGGGWLAGHGLAGLAPGAAAVVPPDAAARPIAAASDRRVAAVVGLRTPSRRPRSADGSVEAGEARPVAGDEVRASVAASRCRAALSSTPISKRFAAT